ncbi:MAG TPA: hypothetical protein VFS43_20810 [Polyangiaceae bacterium]|nr:hypothetical protein [Polyangiaceae bacterium]
MSRHLAFGVLVAALWVGACKDAEPRATSFTSSEGGAPPAVAAVRGERLGELRAVARETLGRNCGECHTGGSATALRGALAVFDLSEPDWSAAMSNAQLREAARRLREPFGPSLGTSETRAISVSAEELARFDELVTLEAARRP